LHLTGHLVLTTLHTNDAVSAIPRLKDIGADPGLALFCHFGKIQRIYVVTAHEKSRFHPSLTEEG
jgi:hypothetical protein